MMKEGARRLDLHRKPKCFYLGDHFRESNLITQKTIIRKKKLNSPTTLSKLSVQTLLFSKKFSLCEREQHIVEISNIILQKMY